MINKIKKHLTMSFIVMALMIFVFVTAPANVFAVPAYPGPMQATQMDGTQFTMFGFGDEFFSWAETTDGHIVAVDPESGNWHYAEISPDGRIVAGPDIVGTASIARGRGMGEERLMQAEIQGLIRNTDRSWANQVTSFEQGSLGIQPFAGQGAHFIPNIRPTNNRQPLLILLIEFNNRRFTTGYAENFANVNHYWSQKVFGNRASFGAYTVNDYFREVSGSFNLQFVRPTFPMLSAFPGNSDGSVNPEIYGVHSVFVDHGVARVRLDKPHPGAHGVSLTNEQVRELTELAFKAVSQFINLESFSTVPHGGRQLIKSQNLNVYSIFAGYEGAFLRNRNRIHSIYGAHASNRWLPTINGYDRTYSVDLTPSQPVLRTFAVSGELYYTGIPLGMGVIAHELMHILGLPDLYSYQGGRGIGPYCMMDAGVWGRLSGQRGGTMPTHLSAWPKYRMGWIDEGNLIVVSRGESRSVYVESIGADFNVIKVTNIETCPYQFFLIENRQHYGFDQGLDILGVHRGILIYHVDNRVHKLSFHGFGANDNDYHKLVDLERFTGGRVNAFFRPENDNYNVFNSTSNPTSNFHEPGYLDLTIRRYFCEYYEDYRYEHNANRPQTVPSGVDIRIIGPRGSNLNTRIHRIRVDISVSDYIYISTAQELNDIRNNLSRRFRLANDIDLYEMGNWIPIGTVAAPFNGRLDGNGNTIRNLTVNRSLFDNAGLFGVNSGVITNLTLENVSVTGRNNTGSLAGLNQAAGRLYNVTVRNIVEIRNASLSNNAGGLVGDNAGNITRAAVIDGGLINTFGITGGLAGRNSGVISQSASVGLAGVSGSGRTGGLVGYNTGTIRLSFSTNFIRGSSQDVGGLIGAMSNGTVEQSYATGIVTSISSTNRGGFIGHMTGGTIRNSFATGNLVSHPFNAGFVGRIASGAIIENSYTLSNNPNGFVANQAANSTILSSYFNFDRLSVVDNPNSPQGRTSEEMQQPATFTDWDFDTVWKMGENGYPMLRGMPEIASEYILIYTATDLNNIRYNPGGNFRLMADIDLAGISWQPIGLATQPLQQFNGSFDGNGHTIRNLSINPGMAAGNAPDNVGFFGISHGEIRDLTLENINIIGRNETGSLVGQNFGNIYNVTVRNIISLVGNHITGGLAGRNYGNLTNTTVNNSREIRNNMTTGGLVGFNRGLIVNSSSAGIDILTSPSNGITGGVGGLVGNNSGTIRLSYSTVHPNASTSTSSQNVGGLAGVMNGGLIERSFATGTIRGTGGNFIGTINSGTIRNSFATGNHNVDGWTSSGFAGVVQAAGRVENSFTLSNNQNGIAHARNQGQIINSYFEFDRLPRIYNPDSPQGRTRAEMQQMSNFIGWDFDRVWKMGDNGYPMLRDMPAPHSNYVAIRTAAELNSIRNNLNGDFRLMNDIDLSGINWQPIGTDAARFTGTLNGNGHTIRNLNINLQAQDNVGLFGVSQGSVSNLTLDNLSVIGNNNTGSVAGQNIGNLYNVTVNNIVYMRGHQTTGGLVGRNTGNLTNVRVEGGSELRGSHDNTGGLAGHNTGLIANASSVGISNILGANNTGGLVGNNQGVIRLSYSGNSVHGTRYVGGLVGIMNGPQHIFIERSYAAGNVSGTTGTIGGFIGGLSRGTIRNTFAIGNVPADRSPSAGFVGSMSSITWIENSYSLSNNPNGFANTNNITNSNIINSYFEFERLTTNSNPNSPHGRTRAQMLQKNNYEGWDFNTIWEIGNDGYPVLRGLPAPHMGIPVTTIGRIVLEWDGGQPEIINFSKQIAGGASEYVTSYMASHYRGPWGGGFNITTWPDGLEGFSVSSRGGFTARNVTFNLHAMPDGVYRYMVHFSPVYVSTPIPARLPNFAFVRVYNDRDELIHITGLSDATWGERGGIRPGMTWPELSLTWNVFNLEVNNGNLHVVPVNTWIDITPLMAEYPFDAEDTAEYENGLGLEAVSVYGTEPKNDLDE